MAEIAGAGTAALLIVIGMIHIYWAFGGAWGTGVTVPIRDGKPLFPTPPAATLAVALGLFVAAAVVLGQARYWGGSLPRDWFHVGTWALAGLFFLRVVGDFNWCGLFKRQKGTPFAWWDTRLFTPICMLLSLGCLAAAQG